MNLKPWVSAMNQLIQGNKYPCPKCNTQTLDFQYVGNLEDRIGYCDIWCTTCNHGIHFSRTKAPDNVSLISFDSEVNLRIPNFKRCD